MYNVGVQLLRRIALLACMTALAAACNANDTFLTVDVANIASSARSLGVDVSLGGASQHYRFAVSGQATASFMTGDGYRLVRTAGWTAVSLPYRGGKLDMVALLPPAGAASCRS